MSAPVLYAVERAQPAMAAPARVRAVVEAVAKTHGASLSELLGRGRQAQLSRARQAAYAAVREATGASYPLIGRWFGRDHTTVLTGVRAHEAREAARR